MVSYELESPLPAPPYLKQAAPGCDQVLRVKMAAFRSLVLLPAPALVTAAAPGCNSDLVTRVQDGRRARSDHYTTM